MKNAIIAAVVAALVSSGATLAATKINGRSILLHSIPQNRLTLIAQSHLKGARGPAGPQGAAGPRGLSSVVTASAIVQQVASAPLTQSLQTQSVPCPSGDIAAGGGYTITGGSGEVIESHSFGDQTTASGWIVTVANSTGMGGQSPVLNLNVACVPAA